MFIGFMPRSFFRIVLNDVNGGQIDLKHVDQVPQKRIFALGMLLLFNK